MPVVPPIFHCLQVTQLLSTHQSNLSCPSVHAACRVDTSPILAKFVPLQIAKLLTSGAMVDLTHQSHGLQVTQLLSTYLAKFGLAPVFTEEEVEHYLMSRPGVVSAFVVESAGRDASQLCASWVQGAAGYL